MINAIVDLSNIFFRSMFSMNRWGQDMHTFDNNKELEQLMRKVSTDLTSILRTITPSRVIITVDSKSWRKQIEIDENEGYKGNREKSGKINWTNIYDLMDEFSDILETNGFIISKINNAEADDLMALWTEEFVKRGEHVILVSGDEDIRQLVDVHYKNNKNIYVTLFNPFHQGKNSIKKFYYHKSLKEWIEGQPEIDQMSSFFNMNNSKDLDKEDFKNILDNNNIQNIELYGPEIGLTKIFCGDDGDNVPAFYTWLKKIESGPNKGKEKEDRITPSKYKKIKEELNLSHPEDLFGDAIPEMLNNILLKITKQSELSINIKDRIDRQMKLVYLKSDLFPKGIINQFNKTKIDYLNKNNILTSNINMNSILEGSKYISSNYNNINSNEISIFNDLDNLTKELF